MWTPAPRFDPDRASEKNAWLSSVSFFRGVFWKRHTVRDYTRTLGSKNLWVHYWVLFSFPDLFYIFLSHSLLFKRPLFKPETDPILSESSALQTRVYFILFYCYDNTAYSVNYYYVSLTANTWAPFSFQSYLPYHSQPRLVEELSSNYFSIRDEIT